MENTLTDIGRAIPARMKSILTPAEIIRGDILFYFRVIDKGWYRAVVIHTAEIYLTLMCIDHGFKGITFHIRRSALLDPDEYLLDSL